MGTTTRRTIAERRRDGDGEEEGRFGRPQRRQRPTTTGKRGRSEVETETDGGGGGDGDGRNLAPRGSDDGEKRERDERGDDDDDDDDDDEGMAKDDRRRRRRRSRSLGVARNFVRYAVSSIARGREIFVAGAEGRRGRRRGDRRRCDDDDRAAAGDEGADRKEGAERNNGEDDGGDGPFVRRSFCGLRDVPLIEAVDGDRNVVNEDAYLVTQWLERGVFPSMMTEEDRHRVRSLVVLVSTTTTTATLSSPTTPEDRNGRNQSQNRSKRRHPSESLVGRHRRRDRSKDDAKTGNGDGDSGRPTEEISEEIVAATTTTLEAFRFRFLPLPQTNDEDGGSGANDVSASKARVKNGSTKAVHRNSEDGGDCGADDDDVDFARAFFGEECVQHGGEGGGSEAVDRRYLPELAHSASRGGSKDGGDGPLGEVRDSLSALAAYFDSSSSFSCDDEDDGDARADLGRRRTDDDHARSRTAQRRSSDDDAVLQRRKRQRRTLSFSLEYDESAPEDGSAPPPAYFTECKPTEEEGGLVGACKLFGSDDENDDPELQACSAMEEVRGKRTGGGCNYKKSSHCPSSLSSTPSLRIYPMGGFRTACHEMRVTCFRRQETRRTTDEGPEKKDRDSFGRGSGRPPLSLRAGRRRRESNDVPSNEQTSSRASSSKRSRRSSDDAEESSKGRESNERFRKEGKSSSRGADGAGKAPVGAKDDEDLSDTRKSLSSSKRTRRRSGGGSAGSGLMRSEDDNGISATPKSLDSSKQGAGRPNDNSEVNSPPQTEPAHRERRGSSSRRRSGKAHPPPPLQTQVSALSMGSSTRSGETRLGSQKQRRRHRTKKEAVSSRIDSEEAKLGKRSDGQRASFLHSSGAVLASHSPKRPQYISFGDGLATAGRMGSNAATAAAAADSEGALTPPKTPPGGLPGPAESFKVGSAAAASSSVWTPPESSKSREGTVSDQVAAPPPARTTPSFQQPAPPAPALTPKRTPPPRRRRWSGRSPIGSGSGSKGGVGTVATSGGSEAPTVLASMCYSTTPPRS